MKHLLNILKIDRLNSFTIIDGQQLRINLQERRNVFLRVCQLLNQQEQTYNLFIALLIKMGSLAHRILLKKIAVKRK